MKYLAIIFIFSISLTSCGSDGGCTPESVAGTYSGTNECSEAIEFNVGDVGDISFDIRHLNDNQYVGQFASGETVNFKLDGCKLTIPKEEALTPVGGKIETSGEGSFSGDNLTFNVQTTVEEVEYTCSASLTKT